MELMKKKSDATDRCTRASKCVKMPDGYVGSLKEEQKRSLEEFRTAVQDILNPDHDDRFLLRWLRARKFNVKTAENMLRKSLAWRKSFGVDEIFQYKFPELLMKYIPGGLVGHDKEGCPIWILRQADIDLHGLIRTFKKSDIIKSFVYSLELIEDDLTKLSKEGKEVESAIFVYDWEDVQFSYLAWKPAFDVYVECLRVFEANYPERLKKCFLINAPSYINYGYLFVKPFLSEETTKKVFIFSKPEEWNEALLQDIDASELPKHWGGTKVDPDGNPKCPSLVLPGGKLPQSSKMNAKEYFQKFPNSKRIVVNRGSSVRVDVNVEESGSVLYWEFMTEGYDIAFGVYRQGELKSQDSHKKVRKYEEIPIISMHRVNCHLVPEDGLLTCEKPGTYVVKFDNLYSWYHKKTLFYNVLVTPSPPTKETGSELHQE